MKLIISLQDGSLYVLSVSQITDIEFSDSFIKVARITSEPEIYFYKDIRSIVIV